MLVGAFDVNVRRPALVGPVPALEREDVGAAAVEPDVENVGDHLVIVGVAVAEELDGVLRAPGVDAVCRDRVDDALVHVLVDEKLAGLALDEEGDGHAPGALAADHPVRAALDHRAETVAALFWDEAGVGDSLHRAAAERTAARDLAVHGDEPLR